MELDTQLQILVRLEYSTNESTAPAAGLCTRVICLLSKLINSLKR